MSTTNVPSNTEASSNPPVNPLLMLFSGLASLRLTVVLFLLSMVLVFLGTLAQVEQDMWEVLDRYFKSWIVMVDVKVLFPPAFFPQLVRSESYKVIEALRFPFVGGATLGVALSLNLLSAHMVRFKIQAKGKRLAIGAILIAAGGLLALLVILSANFQDGLQTEPFVSYVTLWWMYLGALTLLWAAMLYRYVTGSSERWMEQRLLLFGTLLLTITLASLFYTKVRLADEYMRILWQLTQGLGAGVVMLIGSVMVFRRRAGIVVLHAGVGIMMAGVCIAAIYSVEERLSLYEGESANYTYDIREAELAVIDTSPADHNDVVVVPFSLLKNKAGDGKLLEHESLPFDISLKKHFGNAILKPIKGDDEPVATAGAGTQWIAVGDREAAGADAGGEVDLPAAYVTFYEKGADEPIDTHLVSIIQSTEDEPERVRVGDKSYEVYLRFRRTYRPFTFTLLDVKKDDYVGTNTPKNYSSDLRLVDASRGEDRAVHIWMNNPLRYANLTFYQSGYSEVDGKERTDLQVVRNLGWMIPYVACSVAGVGMFWHFGSVLMRFLGGLPRTTATGLWGPRLGTAIMVLIVVYGSMASGRRLMQKDGFDMQAASRIPVMHEGRVKPLGTLAQNTMRAMAKRTSFKNEDGEKLPAIRWLLDLASADPEFHGGKAPELPRFKTHAVFRIDNLEVLQTLGLERRSRFRYALAEFEDMILPAKDGGEPTEFAQAVAEARKLDPERLNTYQRKLLETEKRLGAYKSMEVAFSASTVPLPAPDQYNTREGQRMLMGTFEAIDMLKRFEPPLAVPTNFAELNLDPWQPYASAHAIAEIQNALQREPDPATMAWNQILQAYADNDPQEFNTRVEGYLADLSKEPPPEFVEGRITVESIMNLYSPFTICIVLYIGAFIFQCFAWLFSNNPKLRSISTTILVGCLVVHTLALVGRLYVSGRPAPVTNLYSSAIFIGWGLALAGIFIEMISRLGVGNVLASLAGCVNLFIAAGLANKGDTFTVLQAVLDTDFWLATHVVCITFGYAATFGAGLLGAIYVILGVFTPLLNKNAGRTLNRMTYGMLCFAIFFSFIGTVLGGLWADDSWGRFWGWDPKENGALLIVLWNAVVLHARWGGMIRHRGVAVLSILGNIVTAWSWFGTNELGVGLHSYGFTDGVMLRLVQFWSSQVVLAGIGLIPMAMWRSQPMAAAPKGKTGAPMAAEGGVIVAESLDKPTEKSAETEDGQDQGDA